MQVRLCIKGGEEVLSKVNFKNDESSRLNRCRYINIDYSTFVQGEENLNEVIKSRGIEEVIVSHHFLTANILDQGLYEDDFGGKALVEQDIASGKGIKLAVFGLAYLSWGSKTLEDAFNLYNGIRTGTLRSIEGKNWGPTMPGLNSGEEESQPIGSNKSELTAD